MHLKRLVSVATLIFCLGSGPLLRAARADTWFFVVVETRVHRADTEVSSEHPQERRWYISNSVALPEDERMYSIKKKIIEYFNATVVEPAAKRGVEVDYYDQEMEIDGGSVVSTASQAESEEKRSKDIEDRKEKGGNIYTFNLTFGPAKGEETSQPRLLYRDKEQRNYDGSKDDKTTEPAPVPATPPADATPATAVPALPTAPQILKSTLFLRADRMVRYWKQPDTDNYWSWVPEGGFSVLGPVPAGTKFVVDFTLPDGKPWMSVDCPCDAAAANEMRFVAIPGSSGHMDKRAVTATGTFGFKIRMVNEATGAKEQMMSGKFTVAKYHKGNALPQFKNQFEYYVDHDWLLPIGYFWVNWLREPLAPPLQVMMWFKNRSSDPTKVAAYVFYKGKQIASSKEQAASAGTVQSILTASSDDNDPAYYLWNFTFNQIRGWNTDTSGNRYDAHFLAANPGEYEIKVLWDGNLVRTAKFTVGDDGKIADNGLVAANKIGGVAMILPVHVQGTADGKWDHDAWKTEAFYGNPLRGFSAP